MTVRQPTVDEAVEILSRIITPGFKREQFIFWRNKYGDRWAAEVQRKYRAEKGNKANARDEVG